MNDSAHGIYQLCSDLRSTVMVQSQENQMHTPTYLNPELSLTLTFKERIGSVRNAATMCSIF